MTPQILKQYPKFQDKTTPTCLIPVQVTRSVLTQNDDLFEKLVQKNCVSNDFFFFKLKKIMHAVISERVLKCGQKWSFLPPQ